MTLENVLEEINKNMEYCNQLAERMNLLAQAIIGIEERITSLEKQNEQRI